MGAVYTTVNPVLLGTFRNVQPPVLDVRTDPKGVDWPVRVRVTFTPLIALRVTALLAKPFAVTPRPIPQSTQSSRTPRIIDICAALRNKPFVGDRRRRELEAKRDIF